MVRIHFSKVDGRNHYLGAFRDPVDAHLAYKAAAERHFGQGMPWRFSLIFTSALDDAMNGNIIFGSDTFKAMFVTDAYVPDKDAHTRRSDVTDEVSPSGSYAAGGLAAAVSVTKDTVNDRVNVSLGAVNATSATITAAGAVYYKSRGGAASADESWRISIRGRRRFDRRYILAHRKHVALPELSYGGFGSPPLRQPEGGGPDTTIVRPSDWNDEHDVSGLGSAAEADADDFLPSQLPLATTMPAVDGQLVIEATSDTLLTLKYRGSDGVIRAVELVLTDVPLVEPVLVWTTDEYDLTPLLTVTFEVPRWATCCCSRLAPWPIFGHIQFREQHVGRGRGRGRNADLLADPGARLCDDLLCARDHDARNMRCWRSIPTSFRA